MADTVLYYFNGRGKAECIRLMLCFTNVKFREVLMTERRQVEELLDGGKLQFRQVPLLEIDGMNLVQTGAILRYLANKGGVFGKTPQEAVRMDLLFEGTRDFLSIFLPIYFTKTEETAIKEAKEKGVPRYLPIFNKVLEENGTGVLVGSSVSLADIGLFEVLLSVEDYLGDGTMKDYQLLQEFMAKMREDKGIKLFLEKYRKGRNTEEYVQTCRKVLLI